MAIYIRYIYGIFGREIIKYVVTYGVCIYGSGQPYFIRICTSLLIAEMVDLPSSNPLFDVKIHQTIVCNYTHPMFIRRQNQFKQPCATILTQCLIPYATMVTYLETHTLRYSHHPPTCQAITFLRHNVGHYPTQRPGNNNKFDEAFTEFDLSVPPPWSDQVLVCWFDQLSRLLV
jgi:hypothetical protein